MHQGHHQAHHGRYQHVVGQEEGKIEGDAALDLLETGLVDFADGGGEGPLGDARAGLGCYAQKHGERTERVDADPAG